MNIICHIYSYQRYIVVYVLPVLFLCSYVSNIQMGISLKFILTGFLACGNLNFNFGDSSLLFKNGDIKLEFFRACSTLTQGFNS